MAGWMLIVALLLLGVLSALAAWRRPWRSAQLAAQLRNAVKEFEQQRERLEAKFVELASSSGKPRGLRWTRCDFEDEVAYARDRASGELSAFVAVTIGFEAIEGGGMEEVEAVSNLRAATAVFRHVDRAWQTDGRTVFNLAPHDAIAYFRRQLEQVMPVEGER